MWVQEGDRDVVRDQVPCGEPQPIASGYAPVDRRWWNNGLVGLDPFPGCCGAVAHSIIGALTQAD